MVECITMFFKVYSTLALYFVVHRGFSVVDLLEEARTRRLFAMKRITCHGKSDERVAMREVEVMRAIKHRNIIPLVEYTSITVGHHVQSEDLITEVMLVMPYYCVSVPPTVI